MKFEKNNFNCHDGFLYYTLNGIPDRFFVARFRYNKAPVTKSKFINVLMKHYTVEDYFEKLRTAAPLQILITDGFLVHTSDGKVILDGKIIFGK